MKPEQAQSVLEAAIHAFPEKADWEAYFNMVRGKIQAGAGLDPWPMRTPLNPVFRKKRNYPGYSVQNVAFESIPGYWVTGNLYLPDKERDKVPAVLHTHGHSSNIDDVGGWANHGRFKEDVQNRAAALALMGAVSLTIDMYGYGDSTAFLGHKVHKDLVNMPMQIWNAMRALDFLQELEIVDPDKLAVTGHSGGGTQAFLLSALDERIDVCVPVAMVSARFFGGCTCESGRPIHLSRDHFVNTVMIAAMTAPRPLLVVSDGGDWTYQVPEVAFPFLLEVYKDFGVPENVENVHLPDEGHDYGPSKRFGMYPFMARHLGLDISAISTPSGEINETRVVLESPEIMRFFDKENPVPDGALKSAAAIESVLGKLQDRMEATAEMAVLKPYALRCENKVHPSGVDSPLPPLSWKLSGAGRDRWQSAWQVQVARSPDDFVVGEEFLWDSGKVPGQEQLGVVYRGRPLASSETVYWRVRVWDELGFPGPWSEPVNWTMGIVANEDWQAEWISHPEWLKYERSHLGYRSEPANSVNTPKWIQLDLGKKYKVDEVVLRALQNTVAERLGFPTAFVLDVSKKKDFRKASILADYRENPSNTWFSSHRIKGNGIKARYVRLRAPVLRDLDGDICLALSQIEVISKGKNVAPGSKVTTSDSIESDLWSKDAVVDGKGTPGYNPVANKTIVLGKEYNLEAVPDAAVAHVTGLGHYVLRINGKRVGNRKLSPGWTRYERTVLYDTFDVTQLLLEGKNTIEIEIAGGMYSVPHPGDGRYTKFVGKVRPLMGWFQMDLMNRGRVYQQIFTDRSWKAKAGSITYSHVYAGEIKDLRVVNGFWEGHSSNRNGWVPVGIAKSPGGILRGASHSSPPLKVVQHLEPHSTTPLSDAVHVVDLGQNASVIPSFWARGPKGSRIRIIPAELLQPDGRVDRGSAGGRLASWELILDGREDFVQWEPEFFYHGSRYFQIELEPESKGGKLPEVHELSGLVVHTSAESAGDFSCSSELFNQARELIAWAQRSNSVSVLTDCPHRERLGWLEQYHLNGPALRYERNLANLFSKTFNDMADAQTESGLVPNIAPEYVVFDGAFRDSPEWGSALILAAWQHYLFTGDKRVFEKYYKNMIRYMDYLDSRSKGFLLDHGLGDWYDIGPERPGFAQLTPRSLTASATYYECASILSKIARLLGMENDVHTYSNLAENIRQAFNLAFLDPGKGNYATGSQTANAMPYVLGMVPVGLEDRVFASLVSEIEDNDYKLTSGDVGHAYLLRALAKGGRADIIFNIHHQRERPGYGMQLAKGATSLTEAWDADRRSSQNHFMLGHITEWFYHDLVGIAPDPDEPGFKHVIIRPQPCGDITGAKASYESPYGKVSVEWNRSGEAFILTAELPPNTHGTIYLPTPGEKETVHTESVVHRVSSGRTTFKLPENRGARDSE